MSSSSSSSNVFILGYSGETGKEMVRQLARSNPFKSIVLIGRREAILPVENDGRFVQKVVDFEKVQEHEDVFRGCDIGFCCLGTTRKQSGVDGFIRVDRDYVVNSARAAKAAGCKHFLVITASTSDKNSCILYNRIKGEAEELLQEISFQKLSIFRPAFILVDRDRGRGLECLLQCCWLPCIKCCPTEASVPIEYLAAAMVNKAATSQERFNGQPVEVINNQAIHALGNP